MSLIHKSLIHLNDFMQSVISYVICFIKKQEGQQQQEAIDDGAAKTLNDLIENLSDKISLLTNYLTEVKNLDTKQNKIFNNCTYLPKQGKVVASNDQEIDLLLPNHKSEDYKYFYEDYDLITTNIESMKNYFEDQSRILTEVFEPINNLDKFYDILDYVCEKNNLLRNETDLKNRIDELLEKLSNTSKQISELDFFKDSKESDDTKKIFNSLNSTIIDTQLFLKEINTNGYFSKGTENDFEEKSSEKKEHIQNQDNLDENMAETVLQNISKSLNLLQNQYDKIKKNLEIYKEEKSESQNKFNEIIKDLENQVQTLTAQNKDRIETICKLKQDMKHVIMLETALKEKGEEILKYKDLLQSDDNKYKKLQSEYEEIKNTLEIYQMEKVDAQKSFNETVAELQNQIKTLTDRCNINGSDNVKHLKKHLEEKNKIISKLESTIVNIRRSRNEKEEKQKKEITRLTSLLQENKENRPSAIKETLQKTVHNKVK